MRVIIIKRGVEMRKLIIIAIIFDIVGLVVSTLMLITVSVLYAMLTVVLGIIGLAPLFAILYCFDTCEQNTADISYLYSKVKSFEKIDEKTIPSYSTAVKHNDIPKKPWKCIKCETVNKAEDTVCVNCKTEYSYLNPTFESEPKHKSRFVKFT